MEEIISRDFYQQKKRLLQDIYEENLRQREENPLEDPAWQNSKREIRWKMKGISVNRKHVRCMPQRWRYWLYEKTILGALEIARYFELDVQARCGERDGLLILQGNQILIERMWHDGRYKRTLLRLMRLASSIWMDAIEKNGERLFQIELCYPLGNPGGDRR